MIPLELSKYTMTKEYMHALTLSQYDDRDGGSCAPNITLSFLSLIVQDVSYDRHRC